MVHSVQEKFAVRVFFFVVEHIKHFDQTFSHFWRPNLVEKAQIPCNRNERDSFEGRDVLGWLFNSDTKIAEINPLSIELGRICQDHLILAVNKTFLSHPLFGEFSKKMKNLWSDFGELIESHPSILFQENIA